MSKMTYDPNNSIEFIKSTKELSKLGDEPALAADLNQLRHTGDAALSAFETIKSIRTLVAMGLVLGVGALAINNDVDARAKSTQPKVETIDRDSEDFIDRASAVWKKITKRCGDNVLVVSPPRHRRDADRETGSTLSLVKTMLPSGRQKSTLRATYGRNYKVCALLLNSTSGDMTVAYDLRPTGYNRKTKKSRFVKTYSAPNGESLAAESATMWISAR